MNNKNKHLILTFLVLFGFLLFVFVTEVSGVSWQNKVMMESCQGDYVKYSPGITYCLRIIKQQHTLSKSYFILVSRKEDKDYGHVLYYPETGIIDESSIEKTRVIWAADGIELTFSTGHKMFIPKAAFILSR